MDESELNSLIEKWKKDLAPSGGEPQHLFVNSDVPASKMIRVSTPLIPYVQKLCELHRLGHTQTIIFGLEQLLNVIENEKTITFTPIDYDLLSNLISRLERLEAQQSL